MERDLEKREKKADILHDS